MQVKLKALQRESQSVKTEVENQCRKEISKREIQKQDDDVKRIALEEKLKNQKTSADAALRMKQADYDLLKEGF